MLLNLEFLLYEVIPYWTNISMTSDDSLELHPLQLKILADQFKFKENCTLFNFLNLQISPSPW